ncbi:hypothetical protein JOQ06_014725, partial [Pogonophryne albipinna]
PPCFTLSVESVCQLGGTALNHADVIDTSPCQRTAIESRLVNRSIRTGTAEQILKSVFLCLNPSRGFYPSQDTLLVVSGELVCTVLGENDHEKPLFTVWLQQWNIPPRVFAGQDWSDMTQYDCHKRESRTGRHE